MTVLESIDIFNRYENFIFDCDGVLWTGSDVIPLAVETINFLKAAGKQVFFLTNNSTKSRSQYVRKLTSKGFENISENQMYCSSSLAARYLHVKHPDIKKAFVVGEIGIEEELQVHGISTTGGSSDDSLVKTSRMEEDEFGNYKLDSQVGAIVVGWDRSYNFRKLALASLYIQNEDCLFIATNRDAADKIGENRLMPGGGCMVSSIEASLNFKRKATNCGKPTAWSINAVLSDHKLDKGKTLIVGDRLDTDILAAINGGITSIMTLSGVTKLKDLEGEPAARPNYIIDDIGSLMTAWREGNVNGTQRSKL